MGTPKSFADALASYFAKIGRRGGKARLHTMTADERRRSAMRASKAAAEARTKKATQKRRGGSQTGK